MITNDQQWLEAVRREASKACIETAKELNQSWCNYQFDGFIDGYLVRAKKDTAEIERLDRIIRAGLDIELSHIKEIDKRDKLLDSILGVMKGRLHQNYDGGIIIFGFEYEKWLKDYEGMKK